LHYYSLKLLSDSLNVASLTINQRHADGQTDKETTYYSNTLYTR